MNRIYQGRVTKLELLDDKGKEVLKELSLQEGEALLWDFHQLFQDAVNYYLVALGSLADPAQAGAHRVIRELRQRLEAAWDQFPRQLPSGETARSLRDSIAPWLGLSATATLEEAFHKILEGNRVSKEWRVLALEELLHFCSGEGKIQQEGRSMFPRFCLATYLGEYNTGKTADLRAYGEGRLSSEFHGLQTDEELKAFAKELELGWVVNISRRGKPISGEEVRERLLKAIAHFGCFYGTHEAQTKMGSRVSTFLSENQSYREHFLHIEKRLKEMAAEEFDEIPPNERSIPDRLEACLLFKYFPSPELAELIKVSFPPKEAKKRKAEVLPFEKLEDDAIKLSRGERGYIFPSFTAAAYGEDHEWGTARWKEFDIAAFKEALKALNQFNQKTEEREKELQRLQARLEYMTVEGVEWSPAKAGEGEEEEKTPSKLAGDPRFELGKELLKELSDELVEGEWGITRASLRGYQKIREKWNALENPSAESCAEVVKKAQQEDPDGMGSAPLFYALCESKYHALWRNTSESGESSGHARDMLYAFCDLNQLESDIERKKEAIRLTPAEPRHSRRLFMFSDLTGHSRVRYSGNMVDVSIALKEDGVLKEGRVRLHFSAPRLHRDELLGGGSAWLQPLMRPLRLEEKPTSSSFESAVSLMPDFDREGKIRMLLNFPVDLDVEWLQTGLGKAARWKAQFNGVKDKSIHLHWAGTATDSTRKTPWWENPEIIKDGFTVLGIDLGQRMAAAWALIQARSGQPDTKRPCRNIGSDGEREWSAEIIQTGAMRLPGENARGNCGKQYRNEGWSRRGRTASAAEYEAALELARHLGMDGVPDAASGWVGRNPKDKSYPQQNSALIRLANRRLSRLGTYHRWSCLPDQNEKRAKATLHEVAAYPEHGDWASLLNENRLDAFRKVSGEAFLALRGELLDILLAIAGRTAPLRGRKWQWRQRDADTLYGELTVTGRGSDSASKKVRFQGGLSIERIEQLEGLRKLFQRYNRMLDRNPGKPAKFGKEAREQCPGEPCPALLRKLDQLKEERVNLTAHLILAQALGLRPKQGERTSSEKRLQSDLHGEYEKIPGRNPVDFIVLEDLGKYRTSQRRAPGENARLMKWSHRAVLDKVKLLAEPFGLPVLEIPAAYSSRFNAASGCPGSRCMEVGKMESHRVSRLKEREAGNPDAQILYEQLEYISAQNRELNLRKPGHAPLTLLLPRVGGPLFLSAKGDLPVQADTNAAANLALRAIAAPECMDIHRRIRTERKKEQYVPVRANKREKAAFARGDRVCVSEPSAKLRAASITNFFYDPENIGVFDVADLKKDAYPSRRLISGISWHKRLRELEYRRCVEINENRMVRWREKGVLPPKDELRMS